MNKSKSCLLLAVLLLILAASPARANSGDFSGGVAIGTGYAGVITAPPNNLLIQGIVGIGTTAPTQSLQVLGNVDASGSNGYLTEVPNAATTGTTLNALAKLNSFGNAILASTTDSDGVIGLVAGNAGVTGNAQLTINGQAYCLFDGATTAGDFVTTSSTSAGKCHDSGASRSTVRQNIGQALSTQATAGLYNMLVQLSPSAQTPGLPTGTGLSDYEARWTSSTNLGTGLMTDNGTSAVSVGTTATGSLLNVNGGVSIGSSYVGTAAPTNGLLVQGNVGIGTSNVSGAALWVSGNTYSASSAGVAIIGVTSSSIGGAVLGDNTSNGYYCYLADNGYAINCNGPSAGVSDQRLKKDIRPLNSSEGLEAIMKIQPVHYLWMDDRMNAAHPNGEIGFIAQNVETVLPDLVGEIDQRDDARIKLPGGKQKILEYDRIAAPLVLAIQQLKADNDKLREDFESYKNSHP